MRSALILSLLFFFTICNAQHDKKLSFGLSLIPEYSDYNAELLVRNNEFSIEIKADVYFTIGDKLRLTSGLNYKTFNLSGIDYNLRSGSDFNGMQVEIYNSWIDQNYKSRYLGIPIGLQYALSSSPTPFYVLGELNFITNTSFNANAKIYESGVYDSFVISQINMSPPAKSLMIINLGFGYHFITIG